MKFKLLAGAALAAVFAASGASAQDTGWYGAVDLGYHWPDSIDADSSTTAANGAPYNWDINQEDDWAGFARLGYQINPHWRVELEGGYRPGDIESIRGGANQSIVGLCTPGVVRTAAAPACGSPSGDAKSWTVMGNVIYDILPGSAINPFIGAGVGINHVSVNTTGQFSNVTGAISAANPAIQNLVIDDSDTALAYQLLAGLAWKATDRLNVDVTYRWLRGSDLDFASVGSGALQPGVFSGEYKDQAVTVGLRYSFAAPPPPPPPPPPPQPAAHTVVIELRGVHFQFGRPMPGQTDVNGILDKPVGDSVAILDQAADTLKRYPDMKVQIDGYTDSIGSQAYNLKLSERRAEFVKNYLIAHGVSASQIVAAKGYGKEDPKASNATADGRAQNRRVEFKVENPNQMSQ